MLLGRTEPGRKKASAVIMNEKERQACQELTIMAYPVAICKLAFYHFCLFTAAPWLSIMGVENAHNDLGFERDTI